MPPFYTPSAFVAPMIQRLLAAFTGRKLRQIPPDFGTCTLAEGCHAAELIEYGRKYLKKIRFRVSPSWNSRKTRGWAIQIPRNQPPRLDVDQSGHCLRGRSATHRVIWIPRAKGPHALSRPIVPSNGSISARIFCATSNTVGEIGSQKKSLPGMAGLPQGPQTDIYFDGSDPLPGICIPCVAQIPVQTSRDKFLMR